MKSIAIRFLLPFTLVAVVFSIFIFHETYAISRHQVDNEVRQQASMAMEFNLAIRDYVTSTVHPVPGDGLDPAVFASSSRSVSFVSWDDLEKVRKKFPGYVIRFTSDKPLNPANQSSAVESRVIEFFRRNPQAAQKTEPILIDGHRYIAQFRPRWVEPECLRCHGDPHRAPAALTKRYGPAAGFHWRAGDVAGVDTIAVPVETMTMAMASEIWTKMTILFFWLAFLFGLIILVFHFVVTKRLTAMAYQIHEMASQSEISQITLQEVGEHDEIDVLRVAFNKLFEQLRAMQTSLELRVSQRTADLARANEGLKQEVVDRQRAENASRESEEKFRSIVESSPTAMHFYRLEDNERLALVGVNPAAERMMGVASRELVGKTSRRCFPAFARRRPSTSIGRWQRAKSVPKPSKCPTKMHTLLDSTMCAFSGPARA